MEYVEVYLHIIEAKDIKGVERNGNSDPYIQVMAPNAKGKLQVLHKTETIKNTRNPKYNVELLIQVPSTTDNIVLRVNDWNALLKDKKLGVVVLPLNKMPNHPNVEDHPIEGGGVLKLCTRFIGPIYREFELIPAQEPPKVRFHLEHSIYHPGEVVRGHLIFSDRNLVEENEKGSITFHVTSCWKGVHYLDIHERFDIIQGAPKIWAFQFLIPKRIPTKCGRYLDPKGMIHLYINGPTESYLCAETKINVMPSFEGLEPKFSPRRPEPPLLAPSGLTLTWIDLPKVVYQRPKDVLKFNLRNPGTSPMTFRSLNVSLKYQRITTQFEPNNAIRLVSKEKIQTHDTFSLGSIALGPSENREFRFLVPPANPWAYQAERPSAPFEMSGDVYELNYFVEVEGELVGGERLGISRTPIFLTSAWLTRERPPNYQLSMAPDTVWIASVEDPNLIYPLMAPSSIPPKPLLTDIPTRHLVSEPVPTETFSTWHCETMTRLSNRMEDLPTLTSIFDVPFKDAC